MWDLCNTLYAAFRKTSSVFFLSSFYDLAYLWLILIFLNPRSRSYKLDLIKKIYQLLKCYKHDQMLIIVILSYLLVILMGRLDVI